MTTNSERYRSQLAARIVVLLCIAALACFLGFVCSSCTTSGCKIEKLTEPEVRKAVQPISERDAKGRFTKAVCIHGSPSISSTTQSTHEDGCVTESSTNKQPVASSE